MARSHTTSDNPQAVGMPVHVPAPDQPRGPTVVATDASVASLSALEMGKRVAASTDGLRIVSVVEPIPVGVPPVEVPIYTPESDAARVRERRERLWRQVHQVFGDALPDVDVIVGRRVERLARFAQDHHAAMIVAGLRHHGRFERMAIHRETPLGVARMGRVPVLIVPPGQQGLPRTALVAADLDDACVNAARRAHPLLVEAETVHVLHVRAPGVAPADEASDEMKQEYDRALQATFDRVVAALRLPEGARVECHAVRGHPVDELLDFAESNGVDVIVAGFRRRATIDRLTGPRSVAERVYRGAQCAMLLVPDVPSAAMLAAFDSETEVVVAPRAWPQLLRRFTDRNERRHAQLDIDSLEDVVEPHARYPLREVTYDATGHAVHMTFGPAGAAPRLTHTVPRPESIEIQRRRDGRDLALRIAHAGGYSVLTFLESAPSEEADG